MPKAELQSNQGSTESYPTVTKEIPVDYSKTLAGRAWLRQVLNDARKSNEAKPDWAKSNQGGAAAPPYQT